MGKSDSSTLTEASKTKHPQTSQSKKKLSLSSKRHDDSNHVHYKYNTKDLPTRNGNLY